MLLAKLVSLDLLSNLSLIEQLYLSHCVSFYQISLRVFMQRDFRQEVSPSLGIKNGRSDSYTARGSKGPDSRKSAIGLSLKG